MALEVIHSEGKFLPSLTFAFLFIPFIASINGAQISIIFWHCTLCPAGLQSSLDGKHHHIPSCAGKLHFPDKLAVYCFITQFPLSCQKGDLDHALNNKTEARCRFTAEQKQVLLRYGLRGHTLSIFSTSTWYLLWQFVSLGMSTQTVVLAQSYFTWMFLGCDQVVDGCISVKWNIIPLLRCSDWWWVFSRT